MGFTIFRWNVNCNNTCQRQPSTRTRGRAGAGCPCKGLGAYCNSFCTCGTKRKACQKKPTDLSDTGDSEVSPNEHAAGEDDVHLGSRMWLQTTMNLNFRCMYKGCHENS
ncbi:uncharacterized protein [Apostichopus japonicus]|uniref:uncharacterized protein n=1 Tax=Stichopus japonicus TaxID=307972 RepID=UPI003AB7EB52